MTSNIDNIIDNCIRPIYKGYNKLVFKVKDNQIYKAFISTKYNDCIIRELAILNTLNHESVPRILDMIQDKENLWLIQQWRGTPLHEIELKEEDIPTIISQLLYIFHYLHYKDILHRNINSSNILLRRVKGEIKVTLIGFSKAIIAYDRLDVINSFKYNIYSSESLFKPKEVSEKFHYHYSADVWALGVTIISFYTNITDQDIREYMPYVHNPTSDIDSLLLSLGINDKYYRGMILSMLSVNPDDRPSIEECMNYLGLDIPSYEDALTIKDNIYPLEYLYEYSKDQKNLSAFRKESFEWLLDVSEELGLSNYHIYYCIVMFDILSKELSLDQDNSLLVSVIGLSLAVIDSPISIRELSYSISREYVVIKNSVIDILNIMCFNVLIAMPNYDKLTSSIVRLIKEEEDDTVYMY